MPSRIGRAIKNLLVIVAHVRPIEDLAVFLAVQVTNTQRENGNYDEKSLHIISAKWSRFCR